MSVTTAHTQKHYVFGEGPSDAKIMIVGEAPGAQEARLGRPFVGPSGNLLNELLNSAGILRGMCYVTNVVKEQPPANNIKVFFDVAAKGGPSETKEFLGYKELLADEIRRIKPNVVIAVGGTALWALTGNLGIMNWRGSVCESTLVPGVKVIPIIHPASVLYGSYEHQHYITFDLLRARKQSVSPALPADNREYILRPSYDQCITSIRACNDVDAFAYDIEVSRGAVTCISFSSDKDSVISVPFVDGFNSYFTPPQEAQIWREISSALENENNAKIGQNVTFDSTFLLREYGIITRNPEDTMVAQGILYPDFPKSLGFITTMYTLIPYYKDEGKSVIRDQIKGIALVGNEKEKGMTRQERFWLYNAKDSIVLMEAFPKQVEALIKTGNYETYQAQVRTIPIINFMTQRGIAMDTNGMKHAQVDSALSLGEKELELQALARFDLNPRSPKQLLKYFYETLGHKPYLFKGKPSTGEKALKQLARKGVKEASLLLDLRKEGKMDGTYLRMELDTDNRLRSSINPVGTRFGRFSSSKTIFRTGANMQNQPRWMKKYMLVDRGYIGYNVDLSQAENRIVGYLGPDLEMIDAFEHGIDIHSKTASAIFQLPVDDVVRMDKEEIFAEIGGGTRTHRDWGKVSNHGLNYDFGYRAFALHLEIPEKDAKFLVEQYHRIYPGVRKYHAIVREQLKANRTLTNLFGRKYRFTDRWGDALFKDAYAFIPQSTVADKINRHGLAEMYYNRDEFAPVEILLTVHDSIVFQIPINVGWDEHARILMALKTSLEQEIEWRGRSFSIPADFSMHTKNYADKVEMKARSITPTTLLSDLSTRLESNYRTLINGPQAP